MSGLGGVRERDGRMRGGQRRISEFKVMEDEQLWVMMRSKGVAVLVCG